MKLLLLFQKAMYFLGFSMSYLWLFRYLLTTLVLFLFHCCLVCENILKNNLQNHILVELWKQERTTLQQNWHKRRWDQDIDGWHRESHLFGTGAWQWLCRPRWCPWAYGCRDLVNLHRSTWSGMYWNSLFSIM